MGHCEILGEEEDGRMNEVIPLDESTMLGASMMVTGLCILLLVTLNAILSYLIEDDL